MEAAVRLSRHAVENGEGGPFGAVVVKDNHIVGWGNNRVTGSNDPTAHAEIVAIRNACARLATFSLEGCILYSSCQPCPMCLAAIYWARLDAVYYANTTEDAAAIGFDDAFFYRELAMPPANRKKPEYRIDSERVRQAAWEVFQLWMQKEDRITY